MFNPFHPLTTPLLDAFIAQHKRYFVRQTFPRGKSPLDGAEIKGCFLISHYDNLHEAQVHFDALVHDPARFLYHWDSKEHQEKLRIAAGAPQGYRVYSSTFKKDWNKGINDKIKAKIRTYVRGLGWKPSREEGLSTDFYTTFGELYIKLKYKTQEVRVKFEEIEQTA